jgi:hypothetical protein
MDGRIDGPRWVVGRFPGKFALRFDGAGYRDHVELPEPRRFRFAGPFSIAVWFKNEALGRYARHLASKGNMDWRLFVSMEDYLNIQFATGDLRGGKKESDLLRKLMPLEQRWHFVVAMFEPGKESATKRLYVDGRLAEEHFDVPRPTFDDGIPVWLGDNAVWGRGGEYIGLIDEVAFFSRVLSGKEVEEMFVAGKPTESDEPEKKPSPSAKKEAGR